MKERNVLRAIAVASTAWLAVCAVSAIAQETQQGVSQQALAKVDAYFGDHRGSYIRLESTDSTGAASTAEQFNEAVGVPSDSAITLDDGKLLLAGCRYHSCSSEKGAVLLDRNGEVIAAAIIHTSFAVREPAKQEAEAVRSTRNQAPPGLKYDFDTPVLTIFAKSHHVSEEDKSIFVAWMDEKIGNAPMLTETQKATNTRQIKIEERIL